LIFINKVRGEKEFKFLGALLKKHKREVPFEVNRPRPSLTKNLKKEALKNGKENL